MKYANYKFYAKSINNLGDNMQLIAIDEIYERMGIPKEEIIYIDKNEISTYKGEYVVLPVTMPLVDYIEDGVCGRFSDHIIPVFLGLTLIKDSLLPKEVAYYSRFEPIGCRDERTMNILRKYDIQAYLHGCITATLPKRSSEGKTFSKVFIVDVDSEILSYIPHELMENAEFLTHLHEKVDDPKALMQEYYNRYKNEAKLVITGLLHCSVPCMAAGIPVIVARNHISYRHGWLERLIPLYDKNDFFAIDWYPEPIEYEEHKKRTLQITMNRLRETYNKYESIYELSWFYEQREKKEYIVDGFESIKQYIDSHFTDKSKEYKYSIWGLTQTSIVTANYITQKFPNAKLVHVYDSYRKILFEGLYSESPEEIRNRPDEIILVTAYGANIMAKKLFDEIGKNEDSYFIWN
ncbi:polysaccharide pyruvyl transferase family protein [Lutispora sp.]|uniref:polysaccharide pyruvyl transferase family protein n=1 Tax=Lutispora sp. TaxID=2828727 RepID=UPI002B1FC945|nr:polysaccharide pyruvyl transferase family protein [Lutispora sp.]MEA4962853.1 polysaccharide pyruvyl transferase family protein [Lutispora sp.]